MTAYVILILYYVMVFLASLWLIQGIKRVSALMSHQQIFGIQTTLFQRDHSKMMLFMIFMAVGVILQFIQVLTAGWATFINALFFACLSAYFFICIYSLYDLIRNEKFGRPYA
jgi:hypothetical protein